MTTLRAEVAKIGIGRFVWGWIAFLLMITSLVWVYRTYGRPGVLEWVIGWVPTGLAVSLIMSIRLRVRWLLWLSVTEVLLIVVTSPIWWNIFDLGRPTLIGLIASALGLPSMIGSLRRMQERQVEKAKRQEQS